jgi:hypothetical protein
VLVVRIVVVVDFGAGVDEGREGGDVAVTFGGVGGGDVEGGGGVGVGFVVAAAVAGVGVGFCCCDYRCWRLCGS